MIDTEFTRLDGRKTTDLRDIEIEVGLLDRADGSAQVKLGRNIVLAAVNGPIELHPKHNSMSQKAVVRVTYRMMPFSVEYRKAPYPSRREKEISMVLSQAFESVVLTKMFPRAAIDVHVQMIQSDGGSRTAASIAISTALADAGIPMRGLIGGIASGLYEDRCCLDLSGIEDNVGSGDMPILYNKDLDEISLFQLDGRFTLEQFKTCFDMSTNAIDFIIEKEKEALRKKYLTIKDKVDVELESSEEEILQETPKEELPVTDEPTPMSRPSRYQPPVTSENPPSDISEPVSIEGTSEIVAESVEEQPVEGVSELNETMTTESVEEQPVEGESELIETNMSGTFAEAYPQSSESKPEFVPEETKTESKEEIVEEISNRYSLDVSLEEDDDIQDEETKRIAEKIQRDLEIQSFELGDDE